MMMSNRSIINVYYVIDNNDGSIVMLNSSRATDHLVEANKDTIKKNVVGNTIINYTKITEAQDGCHWVSVNCADVGGSIPDMMKRQGAGKQ